jgi:hypothetical protein
MDKPQTAGSGPSISAPRVRLGVWRSTYWYPSSSRKGIFKSEHAVQLHKVNHYLIAESLPGSHSYLLIRLTLEDNIATGSWHEQTSKKGYYKGVVYHGAIQLVMDNGGARFKGKWVGFGKDMEVNAGDWELEYVSKEPPI